MSEPINNQETPVTQNFLFALHQFAEDMERNVKIYGDSVRNDGKALQGTWQNKTKEKAIEQRKMANISKQMSYVSTAFLVTTVATTVGGAVLGGAGNNAGQLLGTVGNAITTQGNAVATNVSGMHSQNIQSVISELDDAARELIEMKKPSKDKQEENINSMKEKASSATQSALDKTGQAFSMRG